MMIATALVYLLAAVLFIVLCIIKQSLFAG